MTREEAIKELQEDIDLYMPETWVESVDRDTPDGRLITALEMAIKALEQEPCEDAVSRSEIQQKINRLWNSNGDKNYCMETLKDFVTELQPVTPTQRWIPVKERLPEESLNSVIGWDAYRERCVFVQYINGYFQITGSEESFNIVAWMPLPDDYKKGVEE